MNTLLHKHTFLEQLTIAELHVHVGSCISARELWEIAHDQGLRLPTKEFWSFNDIIKMDDPTDYETYLKKFDLTEQIQSSPDAMFKVLQRGIANAYLKSNITTIEPRFNPIYRNKKGLIDLDHIIVFSLQGMERAMLKYPIKAGLILCLDRRLNLTENTGIIKKAIQYQRRGVVGIDLAGSISSNDNARGFEPKHIEKIVQEAKEAGLGITIHTGEVTDTKEMWEVIHYLKPDRLGHGIACVNDKKLMKYLAENQIVLETCPSSNLKTKVVKNWQEMKQIYDTLKANSVPFTINTDGPEFLHTTLLKEYDLLLSQDILTKHDVIKANKLANQASFIK